jgi:hypothetical protein
MAIDTFTNTDYAGLGASVYWVYSNASVQPYLNSGGSAGTYEALNTANVDLYAITATEQSSTGRFTVSRPSAVNSVSGWTYEVRYKVGSSRSLLVDPVIGVGADVSTLTSAQVTSAVPTAAAIATQVNTSLGTAHGTGAWDTDSGGTGSGAYTVTITVNDGTTALQNAVVRFSQGAESYSTTTNVSGQATFGLDAATWTVTITKPGYLFTPTTHAVSSSSGTWTFTSSMTLVSIVPAASPDQTVGYLTTYDSQGNVDGGVTITFKMIQGPGDDAQAFDGDEFTEVSDAVTGLLQVDMVKGATYQGRRDDGAWVDIHASTEDDTFELPEILGRT